MCTYQTERLRVSGAGKGATGWFTLTDASVYFDHPVHATPDHSLNIDFLNPSLGPSERVAVELEPQSALALAEAILSTLRATPAGLWGSAVEAGGPEWGVAAQRVDRPSTWGRPRDRDCSAPRARQTPRLAPPPRRRLLPALIMSASPFSTTLGPNSHAIPAMQEDGADRGTGVRQVVAQSSVRALTQHELLHRLDEGGMIDKAVAAKRQFAQDTFRSRSRAPRRRRAPERQARPGRG